MDAETKLTGTLKIVSRAAAIEAERINDAADGFFWELMAAKINGMIADHQRLLAESENDREIARAQGAVKALQRVLELPAILRKETAQRGEV